MVSQMQKPNAADHNPDPAYMRSLVEASGLSQVKAAQQIGVTDRTMRAWLAGDQSFPYTAQYAMEQLAGVIPKRARPNIQKHSE